MKKVMIATIFLYALASNIEAARIDKRSTAKWENDFKTAVVNKDKQSGYRYFILLEGAYNFMHVNKPNLLQKWQYGLKSLSTSIETLAQKIAQESGLPDDVIQLVVYLNQHLATMRKNSDLFTLLFDLATVELNIDTIKEWISLNHPKNAYAYLTAFNNLIDLQHMIDKKTLNTKLKTLWNAFGASRVENLTNDTKKAYDFFKKYINQAQKTKSAFDLVNAYLYSRMLEHYLDHIRKTEKEDPVSPWRARVAAALELRAGQTFDEAFLQSLYNTQIAPLRKEILKASKPTTGGKVGLIFAQLYGMPDKLPLESDDSEEEAASPSASSSDGENAK